MRRPPLIGLVVILAALLPGQIGAQRAAGHPPHDVEVIYRGPNTVSAAPYLRAIEEASRPNDQALEQAQRQQQRTVIPDATAVGLASLFPWTTTRLQPGAPARKHLASLSTPIFVMGMDSVSLTWLTRHVEELQRLGAQGFVVEASAYEDYVALRRNVLARGLSIDLAPGDAVAEGFGITTYPTLVIGENR